MLQYDQLKTKWRSSQEARHRSVWRSQIPLRGTKPIYISLKILWPGSQAARHRSAKPIHTGAIPVQALENINNVLHLCIKMQK